MNNEKEKKKGTGKRQLPVKKTKPGGAPENVTKKENAHERDGVASSMSPPTGFGKTEEIKDAPKRRVRSITGRTLRIVFVWVPVSVILLVALVLGALRLYCTAPRMEKLAIAAFRSMSYGDISLSVTRFNPYEGFEIRNLMIYNGDEFDRSKFVEIEKLVLRYGFFSIFAGNIHFDEIGIYRPRIYLEEKKGVWNIARLMKPSEKKREVKEEKKAEGPPSKELRLPISVNFLFRFILDDLRMYVKGSGFSAAVEDVSGDIDILVPPFKRIPKSLEAVTILERMKIVLNPKEEMNVSFYSPDAEVQPPLILTWKLAFNKQGGGRPAFASTFKFGTYKTPVRFKKAHLAPLNFMVSYDMLYHPLNDYLQINHIGVSFLNKNWLRLTGSVRDVTTAQRIDIAVAESAIALDDLYPYYVSLTHDTKTRFRGDISLYPLTVRGTPASLDINGAVKFANIYFRNPSAEASVPQMALSYSAAKRGADMKLRVACAAPHFSYALERNRSGDNGFNFSADVSAVNGFTGITVNDVRMKLYNPADGRSALDAALTGRIDRSQGMSGKISLTRFMFHREPLLAMLPASMRKSLEQAPLNKPINANLDCAFSMGADVMKAALGMTVKAPDFDVNDLVIRADAARYARADRIAINALHIGSASKNLSIDAKGTLETKSAPFSDSNLRLGIRLESPDMKTVYGPWSLSGLVRISSYVNGGFADGKAAGSIAIEKLYVKNDEARLAVDDVNLNFPFEYYFTPRPAGESRIAVRKSDLLENENFREKENFTIKSVRAKHPARDLSFEYMRDFSATMFFRDNTFEIVTLRAYVLDGALYGKNIFFNLADMKQQNMEFRMLLDVTNVDIGRLDDPTAPKTRDAELSLNANFSGRGVDVKKELNVQGNVSIYKIGEKFANRLLKGLSTEKGKSKLGGIGQFAVDNTMNVKGFNFNLDKGLVYATVTFSRRAIGYLFGVKDEKVEFERMPVQEYLRKVREVE